ncbi:MAG: RNA polymerase sigma factor [Anaerovoracaceae bacterium]
MSSSLNKDGLTDKERLEDELLSLQKEIWLYLRAFDIPLSTVDDAVQETMLRAWKNIGQLRDAQSMKWWVLKIASNVGKAYVKKEKYREIREISLDERVEQIPDGDEAEMTDEALCIAMENTELEKISELLDRLSDKERQVIVLRYIHELPLTEVAKLVGETYANTRTIASRAMRKLKKYAAKEKKGGK